MRHVSPETAVGASAAALDRFTRLTLGLLPAAPNFLLLRIPDDLMFTVVRCSDDLAEQLLGLGLHPSGPLETALESGRPVWVTSAPTLCSLGGDAARLAMALDAFGITGLWLVPLTETESRGEGGVPEPVPLGVMAVCDRVHETTQPAPLGPAEGAAAFGILRDLWTEAFRTEPALPREAAATIAASVQDAVIVVDGEGRVTFVNDAAVALLDPGATDDPPDSGTAWADRAPDAVHAAFGRELASLRFEDDSGGSYDWLSGPLAWALEGGGVRSLGLREVSRRPQRRLRLSGAPFRDETGTTAGAVLVFHDLTTLVSMRDRLEGAIEVERRRSAQLRALNEFAVLVNSETDPSRILDEVLGAALRLTRSSAGAVYVPSGADLRLKVFVTIPELGEAPHGGSAGRIDLKEIAQRVAAGPVPVRMAEEVVRAGGRFLGYLGVPLVTQGGGLLACVVVVGPPDQIGFTAEDEVLVTTLAAHAGVALENLQRLAREREVAHYLQRSMLPKDIEVPGLLVDHAYESATDAALVGGDFYDVVPLGDRKVAVMVGDVCGKGLPAATFMSFARHTLKTQASLARDAGSWLDAANAILASDPETPSFVTVALAVIDTSNGSVELALAGHPSPVLATAGEVIAVSGIFGLPLGVDPSVRYATTNFRVGPGDTLCLYTDGLIEARSGETMFGERRLLAAVGQATSGTLEGASKRLVDEVKEFAGGRLRDDVVVLVVRPTA
jgi:serine phosphatase RsbU (regulator of sigma subunit)/PAS domain-containing protein